MIDPHHHLWNYQTKKHQWIDDTMTAIRRDFTGDDLSLLLSRNGITGTVLVQVDQVDAETDWLIAQSEKFPFIKGVVGWVDLMSENITDRLAHFSKFPVVKGFRHILQTEPDDFLNGKAFRNGISCLQEFNFTYDLLIYPSQSKAAIKMVEDFPQQQFILDHIAKPQIREGLIKSWAADLKLLSQFPNVYCKVSGIITEANHNSWSYQELVPYLDVTFECFGVDRLMFGSDWPVCLLAGDYNQVLQIVRNYLSSFNSDERKLVMYENAIKIYNL